MRRVGHLPLFWKLLLPFLALMILFGLGGAFVIVRALSERAQNALDQELTRRSLDARSVVHDRELYLLESVNFAANLQGMPAALRSHDETKTTALLRSVVALKSSLDEVAAVDARLSTVGAFDGRQNVSGRIWATEGFVADALTDERGDKHAGLVRGAGPLLAIASPVCTGAVRCRPAGAAVAATSISRLAADIGRQPGWNSSGGAAVTLFDASGEVLARVGRGPSAVPTAASEARLLRRTSTIDGQRVQTLYAPLDVQGSRRGTIAVSLPVAPAFAAIRSAAIRLAGVLLAAMAAAVAVGALLSRRILAQVRPLVRTSRALGEGDLAARTSVIGGDELSELARGVNRMAEQMQASVETLELRVDQRTQEIRKLMDERTAFFASMSHEFRTPLAVIISQAEMLSNPEYRLRDGWADDTGKRVKDSASQLLLLVNDILELAKAEVGTLEVSLEDVRIGEVVADLKPTLERLAQDSRIRFTTRVARGTPLVRADRARLKEIILNLVDNAVKYTPAGGRVALSAAAQNGHVEVSVSDTGVGIPPEAGDDIFRPFFRVRDTKTQHGQPSTGLGLALTRKLVEAHGGEISFSSEPGAGTTFTFTLRPSRTTTRS